MLRMNNKEATVYCSRIDTLLQWFGFSRRAMRRIGLVWKRNTPDGHTDVHEEVPTSRALWSGRKRASVGGRLGRIASPGSFNPMANLGGRVGGCEHE